MKYRFDTSIITNYMEENHLSKTKFCKLCKIGFCTLKKVLNHENFSLRILYKIACAVDVELSDFFALNE